MIKLTLTNEESQTLVGVLRSYLSDLVSEISKTDSTELREHLKHRKAVLLKTIEALESGTVVEVD